MRSVVGVEVDVDSTAGAPVPSVVESGAFEAPVTTRGTPQVRVVNGFRALAILSVVLLHILLVSGVLDATRGTTGGTLLWMAFGNNIDAFFIISGFVLFLPTVARQGDFGRIRRFAIGRATRILPAYWLVMALTLVAAIIISNVVPATTSIAAHFTLLQTPWRIFDARILPGFGINGPVWMISVVVSFYFVLPLIARAYYRHPFIGLALAAAITLGWKEVIVREAPFLASLSNHDDPAYFASTLAVDQLPGWAFSIALGMTGAWCYVRLTNRFPRERLARVSLLALPLVIAGHVVGTYLFAETSRDIATVFTGPIARLDGPETMLSTVFRGALIAVVVLGPVWMQRPFANPITDRLASLSYSVYLVHFLMIVCIVSVIAPPTDGSLAAFGIWIALVVPGALLYAAVSYRYLERPFQLWGRARWIDRAMPDARQDRAARLAEP